MKKLFKDYDRFLKEYNDDPSLFALLVYDDMLRHVHNKRLKDEERQLIYNYDKAKRNSK